MKKLLSYIIAFILLVCIHQNTYAQRSYTDWSGPWGIGVGFGPSSYIGDLNEHNDNRFLIIPQSLGFAGHGWFSKGFGPITLVLQMNLGRLQSRDYTKDQKFRNSFYDYGGRLRLNMNQLLQGRAYRQDRWNMYLEGGLGLMRYSAYLTDMSDDELLSETGYSAIGKAFSIVGVAGIKYYMTDDANLHIAVEYHVLNADDIDAKIIGTSNDAYIYMNIGFSYMFGNFSNGGGRRRSLLWGNF
ncbi:MAG: hypothetical protein GQ527_08875 [Bacteroidales bacterium]|nr:hypothetical protein [Bacteroidales bacterium]